MDVFIVSMHALSIHGVTQCMGDFVVPFCSCCTCTRSANVTQMQYVTWRALLKQLVVILIIIFSNQ